MHDGVYTLKELRTVEKYETNPILKAYGSNTNTESETRILTQEDIDEQIRNYIVPLTRQQKDLTRLSQGMSTAHRRKLYPRVGTSANSSTIDHLPDNLQDSALLMDSSSTLYTLLTPAP